MTLREVRASGRATLAPLADLLHRQRRDHPTSVIWEAADVQWWWRRPRASDAVEQVLWVDDEGPLAAVVLTSWSGRWQCDPIVVDGAARVAGLAVEAVWARAQEQIAAHDVDVFEVPLRDDDVVLQDLVSAAGLVPGDSWGVAAMAVDDRPARGPLPTGYRVLDRTQRPDTLHPMRVRSGDDVEERLGQTELYDPWLDLSVESDDGEVAAYSLYWFDPVTRLGLVEPVRVEDAHQRRGLARCMLREGIERLAQRGAERVKIGFESEAAAATYLGLGFRRFATDVNYRTPQPTDRLTG